MEDKFAEEIKELKSLYDTADSEPSLRSVMSFASTLQDKMELAKRGDDNIYEATYFGFLARYYFVMKYARTTPQIGGLIADVSSIYHDRISEENKKGKAMYGYLLSIIYSELAENFAEAEKIRAENHQLAKDDPVFLLREFNARGLDEMKRGDYEKAIGIFSQVEEFIGQEISDPLLNRHFGNLLSNLGAAYIRGNIDPLTGTGYLLRAGIHYMMEPEPPTMHLFGPMDRKEPGGILGRMIEARRFLVKQSE